MTDGLPAEPGIGESVRQSPQPLNTSEPVILGAGAVTLVAGATFCLSDRLGDVRPGTPHGLFFRDARVISRWELRLDGQTPEPLFLHTFEAFAGQFVLRRAPRGGIPDSTLLIVRERLIGEGMRETITLENLGREDTAVVLDLHVDADFADLFAVKEGRAGAQFGGAEVTVTEHELLLTDRSDHFRGLLVSASGQPVVMPGTLSWRVAVPPGERWQAEVVAQPTLANQRVQPLFRSGEQIELSGPSRTLEAWRDTATNLTAEDPTLAAVLRRTERDLGALLVQDPEGQDGRFVAAGAPWFMTLFGRDSLLTAWMALPLDVGLAVGTLQRLAETQGRRVEPLSEEQPGRILHELRRGPASGQTLGGNHYYGSVDATPLFVMLLAECWRWGGDESVIRSLLPAADLALAWIDQYGDRDGDGFVEYQRATDRGLFNQGWKDSADAINDSTGRIPEPPIALCEVQGYVYAALLARAELAEAFGDPRTSNRLRVRADRLRQQFAESYWLPEHGWYAVALDGRKRPVDALTSNVAHCLWTGIAADEHAAELIKRLAADDMDSGYGLRTLSATMGAYNPMSYHNGSVWPHDTAIAVAGLLRYAHLPGAVELAERLTTGLLDAAAAFGGRLPELFCGFPRERFPHPVPYPTSCSPQAWASAAPLLLVRSFLGLEPHVPRRTLTARPRLPEQWGAVSLTDLRLGDVVVHISAKNGSITVTGLPDHWKLITNSQGPK